MKVTAITGVSQGAVCGLNSTSLECHENFTISSCLCEPGTTEGNNCKLTGQWALDIAITVTIMHNTLILTFCLDINYVYYQQI